MIGDEGIVSALSNKSRCRLITSWGWRRSQGSGCSPVKVVRELGSERRKTVKLTVAVSLQAFCILKNIIEGLTTVSINLAKCWKPRESQTT